METTNQFMTGTEANTMMAGAGAVGGGGGGAGMAVEVGIDMFLSAATLIGFGLSQKLEHHKFKADDVVIQETGRDYNAFIAAGATAMLLMAVILILVLKK